MPKWDAELRELRLGSQLLRRFRQRASCQEAILSAFEEEGWPARIDDPLPPKSGHDAKRRLHSTIENLNRGVATGRDMLLWRRQRHGHPLAADRLVITAQITKITKVKRITFGRFFVIFVTFVVDRFFGPLVVAEYRASHLWLPSASAPLR